MPGFDGTGPRGQGPMTGGGRGYCVVPFGAAGRQSEKGSFYARRGGRGWRNCFYATGLPGWMRAQNEKGMLEAQADFLKQQLEDTQARIKDLEGKQEA
jgi:hypothetical protein